MEKNNILVPEGKRLSKAVVKDAKSNILFQGFACFPNPMIIYPTRELVHSHIGLSVLDLESFGFYVDEIIPKPPAVYTGLIRRFNDPSHFWSKFLEKNVESNASYRVTLEKMENEDALEKMENQDEQ